MSWWQILLLCWVCYLAGFATSALMTMARDGRRDDDIKAGLTDD